LNIVLQQFNWYTDYFPNLNIKLFRKIVWQQLEGKVAPFMPTSSFAVYRCVQKESKYWNWTTFVSCTLRKTKNRIQSRIVSKTVVNSPIDLYRFGWPKSAVTSITICTICGIEPAWRFVAWLRITISIYG